MWGGGGWASRRSATRRERVNRPPGANGSRRPEREEDHPYGADQNQRIQIGLIAQDAPVQAGRRGAVTGGGRHRGHGLTLGDGGPDGQRRVDRLEGRPQAAGGLDDEDAAVHDDPP